MSLPTTKPVQSSIRSFFQAPTPKYAPPPSAKDTTTANTISPPPSSPNSTATATAIATLAAPTGATTTAPPPTPAAKTQIPASDAFLTLPLPAFLPHEADIRPVQASDLNALRRINALLLPVSYPNVFYQRAVDPAFSGRFSRVITWAHDGAEPKVVGGVVCRIEPDVDTRSAQQMKQNLYIQSLCLLSPYRSMGLINAAVDNIIATAVSDPALDVKTVTAHVWTENEGGLHWYEGRGFKRDAAPIQGYYLKLRPDSAWLVHRDVSASVLGSIPAASNTFTSRSVPSSTTAAVVNLPPIGGPPSSSTRPPPPPRGTSSQSFQNRRAETEWNDLPDDMTGGFLAPSRKSGSEDTSATSSRSSSAVRKKKDRSYPVAAFGN